MTLDQITIDQFVQLLSGKYYCLDDVAPEERENVTSNLVMEYHEIVNPTGWKAYLAEREEYVKARISVVIFSICANLLGLNASSNVRMILEDCGVNTSCMNDMRLTAEVQSRLARAKRDVDQMEKDMAETRKEPENFRKDFDAQTATLMSYFKFQIDTATMKASVYAHLVARLNAEVKAKLTAMQKN